MSILSAKHANSASEKAYRWYHMQHVDNFFPLKLFFCVWRSDFQLYSFYHWNSKSTVASLWTSSTEYILSEFSLNCWISKQSLEFESNHLFYFWPIWIVRISTYERGEETLLHGRICDGAVYQFDTCKKTSVLPHGEEESFKKNSGPRHQSRSLLKPHQVSCHFQPLLLKSRKYLQLAINRVQ